MPKPLSKKEIERRQEIKKLEKYVKILSIRKSKKRYWKEVEKCGPLR